MLHLIPRSIGVRSISLFARLWNGQQAASPTNGETKIKDILSKRFPSAACVEVQDISGGCGAMYEIMVQSKEFKGLSIVKQHRLINEALKEEIKEMHGLRIHTSVPS